MVIQLDHWFLAICSANARPPEFGEEIEHLQNRGSSVTTAFCMIIFYYVSVNCIHITYINITLTGGTFCRARAYASSVYCLQRFETSEHTPRWARPCQDIRLRVGLWFFKKEATCISVSTWCSSVITFLYFFISNYKNFSFSTFSWFKRHWTCQMVNMSFATNKINF